MSYPEDGQRRRASCHFNKFFIFFLAIMHPNRWIFANFAHLFNL